MHKYHKVLLFVLFLVIQTNSVRAGEGVIIGVPELLLVGQSGACTYASLQAAIDDASSGDEIRISNEFFSNDTLFENIIIDKDLVIKGGYNNCGLAELDERSDESRTVIDANGSGNVVRIDGDDLTVVMLGFTLMGGVNEGLVPHAPHGGGVSVRGSENAVTFEHMRIHDNHGRSGGGIYLSGSSNEITLVDVLIEDNSAISGGGVYFSGNSNDVTFEDVSVNGNSAAFEPGSGGGVYISGDSNNVVFEDVSVTENTVTGAGSGGGIYVLGSLNEMLLEDVFVDDNHADSGGGIYISGGSNNVVFEGGFVVDNTASNGGGIYCTSPGSDSDLYYSGTHILRNEANGDGGGAFLSNCALRTLVTQSGLGQIFIGQNNASGQGGGVFAIGEGGGVVIAGTVWLNEAIHGGGLSVFSGAFVELGSAYVLNNRSHAGFGGGLYLNSGRLYVNETRYQACMERNPAECLRFEENHAGFGGAMYLDEVSQAWCADCFLHFPGHFMGNQADFGSALYIRGDSDVSMQNAIFNDNGGSGKAEPLNNNVLDLNGEEVMLTVGFSTFADNGANIVFNVRNDASLDLIGSIIYEQDPGNQVFNNNADLVNTHCNVYHEGDSVSIAPLDPSVVTDDPGFVDPENDNYRLRVDSVAIDRCNDGGFGVVYPDHDQDERPIDQPGVDNGLGAYDAGAYELGDLIFENGFE